jgi:hypothetical protein
MAFPYGDGESYDRATNDASFARFVTSMNTPPPETAMLRQPQRQVAGENVGVFAQYAFANGLLLESAVVMLQAGVVRLDCVTWPEVGAFAEVPAHAAGSLRWQ